jgi:hypothetical protein
MEGGDPVVVTGPNAPWISNDRLKRLNKVRKNVDARRKLSWKLKEPAADLVREGRHL